MTHGDHVDCDNQLNEAEDKIIQLRKENKRLKEFARDTIRQECWCFEDIDGGDIQDLAEKLSLIVRHTATEEDVSDESDFEVGDTIFKFSETLEGD